MGIFEEAKEIVELLKRASISYYNEGISIISDSTYDEKKDRLVLIYNRVLVPKKSIDPNLVSEVEHFLNQIGAPVSASEWKKTLHKFPMTSLNKVNTHEEFKNWASSINDSFYVIFDKLDGGSIDLVYDDGVLVQAITRGDGLEGEDMLQNVLKMKNVKKLIQGFSGNIYGEVFILREDFEALIKKSGRDYKNPRNTATGLQKTLDGVNVDFLSVYFYDIKSDDIDFKTEEEKLKTIESFGLKTCFWKKVTLEEAIDVFNEYENKIRAALPYDVDGLVVRANSIDLQLECGMLGGNHKAKIAWKFKPMQVVSKIIDIKWHVGNSKRITPIFYIEPKLVGGITVSKMSGFNVDFFLKTKPYKGAKLLFQRSNDVIPVPLKIVEDNCAIEKDYFLVPEFCPECGEKVEIQGDDIIQGKFLVCVNESCSGLMTGNLERWIDSLKIDNLGPKIIRLLYDKGLVREPADFYKLAVDDISCLDRMGDRSATKIVTNLRAKMNVTLPEFISGLNMPNFSTETAETLIKAGYDTIVKMHNVSEIDLKMVKGVGDKTASQIKKGLLSKTYIIKNLFDAGITIKEIEKVKVDSNKLSNLSFCFTGAIQSLKADGRRYTREDMHSLVTLNGGIVEKAVKKGLSYLVIADPSSTSDKTRRAKELGTKIISEIDFFNML